MKTRYRLLRRSNRKLAFYCVDSITGKRTSLRTGSEEEAQQLIEARNIAARQPAMNLQIAQVYLQHSDNGIPNRTWRSVMEQIVSSKSGSTRERWAYAIKDKALASIRDRKLIETTAEHLLAVLKQGSTSTNVYLRRMHNFAMGMSWLPKAIMPRRQWPKPVFKEKRAITLGEHEAIIAREQNPERHAL